MDSPDLQDYCATGSEAAFRRLVERHVPMVHGVAMRALRNASMAEEITQTVFVILARKARSIPQSHLPGWLHHAASHECRNALRKEARRREVTLQYTEAMNQKPSSAAEPWTEIMPHLDEAVGRLSHEDRQMMILRYFEQQNFHEIAAATGASEEACKKRAQRALDRLGVMLRRRGVTASGPVLGTAVATFALLPPASSAAAISSFAVCSAGSLAASGAPSFFKLLLSMTTKQVTTAAAVPAFKLLTALPPLLALSVGVIWTASESRAAAGLDRQSVLYEKSLAAASRAERNAPRANPMFYVAVLANGKIDWQSFSGNFENKARLVAMRKRLGGLSAAGLIAEFEEIDRLDATHKLDKAAKEAMEGLVLEEMAYTDPKMAIDRFGDTEAFRYTQETAFANWSRSSPAEATKWLDQKTAEGFFATSGLSRNPMLVSYETPAIYNIMQTDTKAASSRLQKLSQQQRSETIHKVFRMMTLEQSGQMAEVIRTSVPRDDWDAVTEMMRDSPKGEMVLKALAEAAVKAEK